MTIYIGDFSLWVWETSASFLLPQCENVRILSRQGWKNAGTIFRLYPYIIPHNPEF